MNGVLGRDSALQRLYWAEKGYGMYDILLYDSALLGYTEMRNEMEWMIFYYTQLDCKAIYLASELNFLYEPCPRCRIDR